MKFDYVFSKKNMGWDGSGNSKILLVFDYEKVSKKLGTRKIVFKKFKEEFPKARILFCDRETNIKCKKCDKKIRNEEVCQVCGRLMMFCESCCGKDWKKNFCRSGHLVDDEKLYPEKGSDPDTIEIKLGECESGGYKQNEDENFQLFDIPSSLISKAKEYGARFKLTSSFSVY